jgi:hypothetical protein
MFVAAAAVVAAQSVLDSYKEQLVGDAIVHTHLTALYGERCTSHIPQPS